MLLLHLENTLTLFFKSPYKCETVTWYVGILMVASFLMTIHKQKSKAKPRVLQCNLFFSPNSFQRAKQRDGIGPTVPPCFSLSIIQHVQQQRLYSLSLYPENRAFMWSPVLPRGSGMESCCFTYKSPRWRGKAGVAPASCGAPGTESSLDQSGRQAGTCIGGTCGQVGPKACRSVLQAAQTFSLGSPEYVVVAPIKQVLALWQGLPAGEPPPHKVRC